MSGTTLQAVHDFCNATNPAPYDASKNERLWGHDLVHTMTGCPLNIHAEEIPGIYQAVLFRDLVVTTKARAWQDGGQNVTLSDIYKHIMPGVYAFKREEGKKWDCLDQAGPQLTEVQIEDHFVRAKVLAKLLYEALGNRHLGQVPLAEVQAMDFALFEQTVKQMHRLCDPSPRHPRIGPAGSPAAGRW